MGMGAGPSGGAVSEINVTPLIDVLLVLLIIFMVIVPVTPAAKTMTPVIGLPMTSTAIGTPTADQMYKKFASGMYDSVLQGVVKAWADNGFKVQYWRPGWEMNLNSMPSYAGDDAATREPAQGAREQNEPRAFYDAGR